MTIRPFRTGETWLTDDQLILLDVLFDTHATFRLLRRHRFHEQWNLGYVHDLDDDALKRNLKLLCERGILNLLRDADRIAFRMTCTGGQLWSRERCPDWTRYCTEQYRDSPRGRELMTVLAVSADVRDQFLTLWPRYPARRKIAVIRDRPLIEWHPFPQLYIGLASYDNRAEEVSEYREHRSRLERGRSWWRTVPELQRFVAVT